jgi:hypothetical protein
VLPAVAIAAAEKTNEPLFPTVKVSVDGETVTPEGNPVVETVIDPEKPLPEAACTCTFCVPLWDRPIWVGLNDNVKVAGGDGGPEEPLPQLTKTRMETANRKRDRTRRTMLPTSFPDQNHRTTFLKNYEL